MLVTTPDDLQSKGEMNPESIIGQFGVGFYSAFMVADKIEVFSMNREDSVGHRWESDGTGKYTIQEWKDLDNIGTKVVIHLKSSCAEFRCGH